MAGAVNVHCAACGAAEMRVGISVFEETCGKRRPDVGRKADRSPGPGHAGQGNAATRPL